MIEDSVGEKGRHNFIQNWGFGTSGCVLRRIESRGSTAVSTVFGIEVPLPASSEFHHSLATANLVEDSVIDDGFIGANRGTESSGAGHSASENVFWNIRGSGTLRSLQYGNGYVVGTAPTITVVTASTLSLRAPRRAARPPKTPSKARARRRRWIRRRCRRTSGRSGPADDGHRCGKRDGPRGVAQRAVLNRQRHLRHAARLRREAADDQRAEAGAVAGHEAVL